MLIQQIGLYLCYLLEAVAVAGILWVLYRLIFGHDQCMRVELCREVITEDGTHLVREKVDVTYSRFWHKYLWLHVWEHGYQNYTVRLTRRKPGPYVWAPFQTLYRIPANSKGSLTAEPIHWTPPTPGVRPVTIERVTSYATDGPDGNWTDYLNRNK